MILSITIPDEIAQRVVNALALEYGYQAQIPNSEGDLVVNPQTKAQFVKQQIIRVIKEAVKNQEALAAATAAKQTAEQSVDSQITLS